MAQPSLRVRVGDRVVRLTSDGNRYTRGVSIVTCIEPRDDVPGRSWVFFNEDDDSCVRAGKLHKDGSATVPQLRLPRAGELT